VLGFAYDRAGCQRIARPKAGLIHLTHVLAMELGALWHPWSNALAPGYVERPIFNREYFQSDAGKRLISRIPLRRIAQGGRISTARLFFFLASPASAYVTGAVIAVDGRPRRCRHLIWRRCCRASSPRRAGRNGSR